MGGITSYGKGGFGGWFLPGGKKGAFWKEGRILRFGKEKGNVGERIRDLICNLIILQLNLESKYEIKWS